MIKVKSQLLTEKNQCWLQLTSLFKIHLHERILRRKRNKNAPDSERSCARFGSLGWGKINKTVLLLPGKSFCKGIFNTVDLLVLTSLDRLLFTLKICYKTIYLNLEVNCTEPSPSVSVPCSCFFVAQASKYKHRDGRNYVRFLKR